MGPLDRGTREPISGEKTPPLRIPGYGLVSRMETWDLALLVTQTITSASKQIKKTLSLIKVTILSQSLGGGPHKPLLLSLY